MVALTVASRSRIERFSADLDRLCSQAADNGVPHVDDDMEQRALSYLQPLLWLLHEVDVGLAADSTALGNGSASAPPHGRHDAAVAMAHCVVVRAMEVVFQLPPEDIGRLVRRDKSDLGLFDWAPPAQPTAFPDGVVLVRRRTCSVPTNAYLQRGERDAAVPTPPPASAPPPPSPQSSSEPHANKPRKADVVVEEVRRSIEALKHNAGRLHAQFSSDNTTLDNSGALMERTIAQATKQTSEVDRISGESGGGLQQLPGGALLVRIPGLALLWSAVLLPLWAVVRQAVLMLLIVAVTVATVWMMLLVPRAYVRVVSAVPSQ